MSVQEKIALLHKSLAVVDQHAHIIGIILASSAGLSASVERLASGDDDLFLSFRAYVPAGIIPPLIRRALCADSAPYIRPAQLRLSGPDDDVRLAQALVDPPLDEQIYVACCFHFFLPSFSSPASIIAARNSPMIAPMDNAAGIKAQCTILPPPRSDLFRPLKVVDL